MPDLFISYASEDRPRVKKLAKLLAAHGWSVFWDRTIPIGDSWALWIDQKLRHARCVIVVWSESSVRSPWVQAEAEEGYRRGILVPILFDDVELPVFFRPIQSADLRGWNGQLDAETVTDLVRCIKSRLGKRGATETHQSDGEAASAGDAEQKTQPGRKAGTAEAGDRGNSGSSFVRPPSKRVAVIGAATLTGIALIFSDLTQKTAETLDPPWIPEMVTLDGRCFLFGSPDSEIGRENDEVQRTECVEEFAIGRYEVTFAQFDHFSAATGRLRQDDNGWGRGNRPVTNVNWSDATAYVDWLSEESGRRFRLPTEVEWEYAARAGILSPFWWGDNVGNNRANCSECGSEWDGRKTSPVGSFEPNDWGIYDTSGNVWEWVQKNASLVGAPEDRVKLEDGAFRLRGGAWDSSPLALRSANRGSPSDLDMRRPSVGFRVAEDID